MKKVCFVADRFFWEEEMDDLLYQEINKISNEDHIIEFYFHTCHEVFTQRAVGCIQKLKEERPEKQLSIVAVIDPLKWGEAAYNEEILFRYDQFPRGSVDRIDLALAFDGKCEKNERRFIQHFYKINRWLYHQCDDMIAYYYDNLPNITLRTTRSATTGKSRPALHHLYLPKTKDRIDILIEQLPERERNAVLAINSGTTYRQLAEQLGVSYNRAQQLTNRGDLQIRRWLRQSYI